MGGGNAFVLLVSVCMRDGSDGVLHLSFLPRLQKTGRNSGQIRERTLIWSLVGEEKLLPAHKVFSATWEDEEGLQKRRRRERLPPPSLNYMQTCAGV